MMRLVYALSDSFHVSNGQPVDIGDEGIIAHTVNPPAPFAFAAYLLHTVMECERPCESRGSADIVSVQAGPLGGAVCAGGRRRCRCPRRCAETIGCDRTTGGRR